MLLITDDNPKVAVLYLVLGTYWSSYAQYKAQYDYPLPDVGRRMVVLTDGRHRVASRLLSCPFLDVCTSGPVGVSYLAPYYLKSRTKMKTILQIFHLKQ